MDENKIIIEARVDELASIHSRITDIVDELNQRGFNTSELVDLNDVLSSVIAKSYYRLGITADTPEVAELNNIYGELIIPYFAVDSSRRKLKAISGAHSAEYQYADIASEAIDKLLNTIAKKCGHKGAD